MTTKEKPAPKPSQATLKAMNDLKRQILSLSPDAPEFGAMTAQYVGLLGTYNQEHKAENGAAINDHQVTLAKGIQSMVNASKLADLLGEPVLRVVWEFVPAAGENGPSLNILVNPKRVTRTPGAPRAPKANGEPSERRDLQALYDAKATAEDRAAMAKAEAEYKDDPKKRNSATWAIKNRVANRA